jgi:acetyl-CoA C-acetyltransferase
MYNQVAIIGVGWKGFEPTTPDFSYKELVYEAANRAYQDANVDPRKDIQNFITVAEDFNEGTSIFDEYTPDQLGAVLKPVHTIAGDGLHGLATAWMLIRTGQFDLVAVEGHSKASNILTLSQCAQVVVKNKRNALKNPSAPYALSINLDIVLSSQLISWPLYQQMCAAPSDGAIVMVLASERLAKQLSDRPVWIIGAGWCNDSASLESRDWGKLAYIENAAHMAYRQAGIHTPSKQIDFAEIDDQFSYKELQSMEALGLCRQGEAGKLTQDGFTSWKGEIPVNVSGGSLGQGHLLEATGLAKALEVVLQLRGEAGARQLKDIHVGLSQSWRGVPTTSGAVVVMSN